MRRSKEADLLEVDMLLVHLLMSQLVAFVSGFLWS